MSNVWARMMAIAGTAFRLFFACAFFLVQIVPSHVKAKTTEQVTPPTGRLALVVGISDYDTIPDLKNPGHDAKAIGETLTALGFDVEIASDVDLAAFNEAIDRVERRANGKETVLFYFAGHGFQLGGRNYLVPSDAYLTDRTRIPAETIALDDVIARLENRNRQTLVLLDACRNNPIPRSAQDTGNSDGLAQIETGSGTFIAFATQPGNITNDGAGQNSPFTRALVDNMVVEGISISDMMIRVRNQVEEATLHKQTPWDQSSLRSQFYFNPSTEETDSLTEEDLALLEELDPALREKFKKRFGLVNLDAPLADSGGEAIEIVATVKPTLLIEPAVDSPLEQNPATATVREASASDGIDDGGQTPDSGEIEIAALDPEALKPRKPGLMIVAAEPEEPAKDVIPALPTLDGETVMRVEIPLPVARPDAAPRATVDVASLDPAIKAQTEVKPTADLKILAPSITGSFVAPQLLPGPAGPQMFIPAKPEPETKIAALEPSTNSKVQTEVKPTANLKILAPSITGSFVAPQLLPGPAGPQMFIPAKPEPETEIAALEPSTNGKVPRLVRSLPPAQPNDAASQRPSEKRPTLQPAAGSSALVALDSKPESQTTIEPTDTEMPAPAKLAPTLTPAPVTPEKQLAALQPPETLTAPEAEELPEEAALPPAPPTVAEEEEEEETLSEKELATKAQRELARLGCYRSTIDGDWGPKSARALLRFYAAQKLDPDDVEPTTALIKRLEAVETVVCETTKPSRPAASSKPAKAPAKAVTNRPSKPSSPAVKRSNKPAAAVARKSSPAPKATASKKKLTGKSIIGAFR